VCTYGLEINDVDAGILAFLRAVLQGSTHYRPPAVLRRLSEGDWEYDAAKWFATTVCRGARPDETGVQLERHVLVVVDEGATQLAGRRVFGRSGATLRERFESPRWLCFLRRAASELEVEQPPTLALPHIQMWREKGVDEGVVGSWQRERVEGSSAVALHRKLFQVERTYMIERSDGCNLFNV
jgi:hypothetical protein